MCFFKPGSSKLYIYADILLKFISLGICITEMCYRLLFRSLPRIIHLCTYKIVCDELIIELKRKVLQYNALKYFMCIYFMRMHEREN